MRYRSKILIIVLGSLALSSLACGLFGRNKAEDDQSDDSGSGESSTESSRSVYPGISVLALDSYHAIFEATFDGETTDWTYRLETAVTDGNPFLEYGLSMDGLPSSIDPGDITYYRDNRTQYMLGEAVGTTGCLIFPPHIDISDSFLTPDSFLDPDIVDTNLRRQGTEEVAGERGPHFEFKNSDIGDFSEVTGDIVLSSDDVVLRYDFTGNWVDKQFLEGEAGVLTLHYEVVNFSGSSFILPESCTVQYPLTDDASNLSRLPGLITYTTGSSVEEAIAFYQEALAAEGWAVYEFPQIQEDRAVLTYVLEGEILSVAIEATDDGTEVSIFTEDRPQ